MSFMLDVKVNVASLELTVSGAWHMETFRTLILRGANTMADLDPETLAFIDLVVYDQNLESLKAPTKQ